MANDDAELRRRMEDMKRAAEEAARQEQDRRLAEILNSKK